MDEYIEEGQRFSPKKILLIGLISLGVIILIIFLFSIFKNKKETINYDSLNQDIIKATKEYLKEESEYKSLLEENTYVSVPVSVLIDKNLLLKYDKTDKKFKELTDDMCEDILIVDEKEQYKEKLRLCGSTLIYDDLKLDEDEIENKNEEEIKELLFLNIDAYDKNNKKEITTEVVEILSINDSKEILLNKGENEVSYKYNDIVYSRKVIVGDYKSCIIEYKSNYGENKTYKTIKTEDYDNVNIISSKPVRALYKFTGWSMDNQNNDVLYKPNEKIECAANKEIILYAMWEKNNLATYKLLYYAINNKDNSKYQKVKEKTIKNAELDENGKVIVPEAVSINGLKYNENYTKKYYSGKDYYKVDLDGNITSIYFYDRIGYKITFDFKGGNSGTTYTNCYTSLSLNKITIPKRSGYTFEGYYLGENGNGTKYYDKNGKALKTCDLSKNTTLYANWKKDNNTTNNTTTSTLIVNPNGGSWNGSTSIQSFTQKYSTTKYIAPPSRSGYTFEGWSVSNTNYGVIDGTTYTYGIVNGVSNTLTAMWKQIEYPSTPTQPTETLVTLVVNPNGGSFNSSTEVQKFLQKPGTTKYIPNASRSGYTFNGWALTGAGGMSGTTYTFGNQNGTLTAKWVKNNTTGTTTLKVNPNGGSWNGSTSTQTFTQNIKTTKSIANPSRNGYTFAGWTVSNTSYGNISGTTYTFGSTSNVTNTLTAKWNQNSSLTLGSTSGTFYTNGSSKTIQISGTNYGSLSCSSNSSSVATCSISGTNFVVKPGSSSGTATITVSGSTGVSKTYTATVQAQVNVTLSLSPTSGTMNIGERKYVTISGSNYGNLGCYPQNDNIATCSINGNTLIVTAENRTGTTSIVVEESKEHKYATYTVTVSGSTTSSTSQEYYYCNFCESTSVNCEISLSPGVATSETQACSLICMSRGYSGSQMLLEESGFIRKYVCTCYTPGSLKGYCSSKE